MITRTTAAKSGLLLSAAAVIGGMATSLSPSPAAATVPADPPAKVGKAAAEVDEAGTWAIANGVSLSPGATAGGYWNNTPQGNSYFVDVRPTATTVTTACRLEVVRSWRVQNWNADNTRELEIHWQVKNVGTAACKGDVYLSFVR